jgi:hypothetical protein
MSPFGRKANDLAKIMVQRDEGALFGNRRLEDPFIVFTSQSFLSNRLNVMADGFQKGLSPATNVFIQFKFHAPVSVGTGMIRSRAASAP